MYFFYTLACGSLSHCGPLCVFVQKCTHTRDTQITDAFILLHFPASLLIPVILNKDAASTAGEREFEEDMRLTF